MFSLGHKAMTMDTAGNKSSLNMPKELQQNERESKRDSARMKYVNKLVQYFIKEALSHIRAHAHTKYK